MDYAATVGGNTKIVTPLTVSNGPEYTLVTE
jgi:hypothetical protein